MNNEAVLTDTATRHLGPNVNIQPKSIQLSIKISEMQVKDR